MSRTNHKSMTHTLSPSTLTLLKDCPRCFWLHYKKGIRRPSGAFPSLPGGMDKILKAHFDRFRDKGLLPIELIKLDVKLFEDKELLDIWRNNRKGIQWTDSKGNVIKGAVDNLLKKDNKLIVLDYKTRGYPLKDDTAAHYKDQLDIYNFLLRKNGYDTEDYAYLLFYHPKEVKENGDVIFHTDLVKINISIKNAENIIKKALDLLDKDMPKKAERCPFCKWVESCNCTV